MDLDYETVGRVMLAAIVTAIIVACLVGLGAGIAVARLVR